MDPCLGNCRTGALRKLYQVTNHPRTPVADNSESSPIGRHTRDGRKPSGGALDTGSDIPSSRRSCLQDRVVQL